MNFTMLLDEPSIMAVRGFFSNLPPAIAGIFVVFILFLLCVVVNHFTQKLLKRENQKRKEVSSFLAEIRQPHRTDKLKEKMDDSELYLKISRTIKVILGEESYEKEAEIKKLVQTNPYFEAHMMGQHLEAEDIQTIQKESKHLLKKKQTSPWKAVWYLFIQLGTFIAVLTWLLKMSFFEMHAFYPFITAGIFFLTKINRDNRVIIVSFTILLYFLYGHFNGTANIFLWVYFIGTKCILLYQQKKAKEKILAAKQNL